MKKNRFGLCMMAPHVMMRRLCEIGEMTILKIGLGKEAPWNGHQGPLT